MSWTLELPRKIGDEIPVLINTTRYIGTITKIKIDRYGAFATLSVPELSFNVEMLLKRFDKQIELRKGARIVKRYDEDI